MSNWKVILTIVLATTLIFGAGVFTGGLLVNQAKHPRPKTSKHLTTVLATNLPAVTNSPSQPLAKSVRPPEILRKQFLQQLDEELRLNPEQHEAVQKIINEGQNLIRKAVQDARLEILEVLTPEQRDKFDELVKRPFRRPLFATNAPPQKASAVTANKP